MKLIVETEPGRIRFTAIETGRVIERTDWLYSPLNGTKKLLGRKFGGVRELVFLGESPDSEELAKDLRGLFPGARVTTLSDEAFFSTLPDESRFYAIPDRLGRSKLRRRGGFGLVHEWVGSRLELERPPAAARAVSVFLGDSSNMVALRDGRAVETSIGFSAAEGLPSLTSSGDLDPTILFELHASGMSIPDIEELVTAKSGIRGCLGENVGFRDFLARRDPEAMELREVFVYQTEKYIGGYIALLGGIDAVAFVGEACEEIAGLVEEICADLRFLGLDAGLLHAGNPEPWTEFSAEGSAFRAFFAPYDRLRFVLDLSAISE